MYINLHCACISEWKCNFCMRIKLEKRLMLRFSFALNKI